MKGYQDPVDASASQHVAEALARLIGVNNFAWFLSWRFQPGVQVLCLRLLLGVYKHPRTMDFYRSV